MLSPQEVAEDETIFRPDGFIKFPRSDGDPLYNPPNTEVPPKSDKEVNYYHVFSREEKRHDTWRGALGEQLAQHFKLDTLSRSKAKWKLYDFPENYAFTEQRKGPAYEPRTDPYLFGSQGHRFRSTREALEHFIWLLSDPDMNVANCRCKYCHKGPRASPGGDGTPKKAGVKRKGEPLSASSAAQAGRRGRKSQNGDGVEVVQSQTAITVRGVEMTRLVPGHTIASVPQRDQETSHALKRGEKERFRVGEVAWCTLDEPVVDPSNAERQIKIWPVVFVDPSLDFKTTLGYDPNDDDDKQKSSLEAVSAPSKRAASPRAMGAVGAVEQSMAYHVNLFGTTEKAKVSEASLTPFLAGFIPDGSLLESDLGSREDHQWLFSNDEFPHLNLSRQPGLAAPDFTRAIVTWGFAIEAAAVLRNLYNVTDAYSGSDTPQGVLRDLGGIAADGDAQSTLGMRYYQGIYFGLERLWVGDVVRLKLSRSDIKKLQQQLNAALVAETQPGAPEAKAIVLDEEGSYVLQLAAIYEDPRAPKTIRVAGEIYQVMPQAKYNAIKADVEASIKKLESDDSLDAAARQEEAKQLEARLPQPSILAGKPGFPPMPPLPAGFVMISLNDRLQTRIPRETTLTISHVAGRMYPSLGMHSDGPRVAEQIKAGPTDRKSAADEDTQVELRARLSVAGLLSGCVKAMRGNVLAWTRTASFKAALALAKKKMSMIITGEFDDSDMEEMLDASPSKTAGGKKGKGSAAAGETPAKASNGVEVSNGATAATELAGSAASGTNAQPGTLAAAADAETGETSQDEPPLAPGWVPRKSRNLGSYYYVHTETKKTQWERPTL
ncbi:hypothetical protein PHSY_006828 [Pseudozyma hubeiensis SY62]|uniref:WW domain-containing protein n=1 Tax=Pseudozyma hubeiensis (strain SY62) TaxID=1305764 RepID=R9PCW0_PSEHS|nr:hypothetical protein PHSY_006828 [Pseudozyma hubeiensis SY62]GAC99228.1 hypothetical protein PHSY_006828 [Pseudozyma hubeiensis SY62]